MNITMSRSWQNPIIWWKMVSKWRLGHVWLIWRKNYSNWQTSAFSGVIFPVFSLPYFDPPLPKANGWFFHRKLLFAGVNFTNLSTTSKHMGKHFFRNCHNSKWKKLDLLLYLSPGFDSIQRSYEKVTFFRLFRNYNLKWKNQYET